MESTERAVVRLTRAHTEMTDAGPVEWPPLLVWLEQSVTEVVKRGGAGSNGAGVPIDFEALHLLNRIRKACAQIREALFLTRKTGNLAADVAEAWTITKQARDRHEVDDTQWERIRDELEKWVQQITTEQDARARKMELTVPCPQCGERWMEEPIDDLHPELGNDRKPAVVIEYSAGRAPIAECRVVTCEAMWVGWSQVRLLGVAVGAEQDRAVLAACGIDTPEFGITLV
jgi:hypothetical protein